jgi:L-fuculose-phosphate aldolase
MSKLYTAKDLEAMIAQGQCLSTVPADAKLTPMARDIIRKHKKSAPAAASASAAVAQTGSTPRIHSPELPNVVFDWQPGGDPKTATELEAFFYSPKVQALKERICAIGERIWNKGYVDGNGGNITVRVGDNLVLCTPTLISKGFMKPDDICMVDLDGNQVAGTRPRTSEVNTHLAIMKSEPNAKSCVHAHPIYATAFAVAGVTPPSCLIPEPEVFLGEIGFASYQTPGSPENASEVGKLAKKHQSILMHNHGVIGWGMDVEDAYWKMENTDAFCHTVTITMQIGGPKQYGPDKLKELIQIRKKLGMPDHRLDELEECALSDAGEVTVHTTPQPAACACEVPKAGAGGDVDEALVQKITDMILEKMK